MGFEAITGPNIVVSGAISGAGLIATTNSLGGDVNLNNITTFFDGPAVAQGTTGTWFVSGNVTLQDTGGAANMLAKLWDGTTVIDSGVATVPAINQRVCISLSGFIRSPVGNIRISVLDATLTSGLIVANTSGAGKDSTITAIRIA